MNQEENTVDFYLTPSPGAKAEFLATVRPVDNDNDVVTMNSEMWNDFRKKVLLDNMKNPVTVAPSNHSTSTTKSRRIVVLEDYTREGWAWKPNTSSSGGVFLSMTLQSLDGRNKLPGFVRYLKDRQKSVYGRIYPTYIVVISYLQNVSKNHPDRVDCRFCSDMTKIPNISLQPKEQAAVTNTSRGVSNGNGSRIDPTQPKPIVRTMAANVSLQQTKGIGGTGGTLIGTTITASETQQPPKKKSGLLSALVGAQKRTNMAVAVASAPSANAIKQQQQQQQQQRLNNPSSETSTSHADANSTNDDNEYDDSGRNNNNIADDVSSSSKLKTAQEVFAEFRQYCSEIMLDFDMDESEDVMKIPINLPEYTMDMVSIDEKAKVTMEILKYMIYEAAEEVNESWVAVKEPTEFLDEMTIVIYKEGAAPAEVIEELNKGELPDEIVQQQRAIATQRQRGAEIAHQKETRLTEQQAHQARNNRNGGGDDADGEYDNNNDDDMAALNQTKRDRRSVEEYERSRKQQRR